MPASKRQRIVADVQVKIERRNKQHQRSACLFFLMASTSASEAGGGAEAVAALVLGPACIGSNGSSVRTTQVTRAHVHREKASDGAGSRASEVPGNGGAGDEQRMALVYADGQM